MRTQRGRRQIELAFHPSFRRPVKIRVETEPLRPVDRTIPLLPAGVPLFITRRVPPPPRPRFRIIRLQLRPQPDWRIVGDQDPELEQESEATRV
jgi:hypothetical protein